MSQGNPATPVPDNWIVRLTTLTKFMFTFNAGMLIAVPTIVSITHSFKIGGTEFAIFIGASIIGIINASGSLIILLTKSHATEGALDYGSYAVARNLTISGLTIGLIALLYSAYFILDIVYKSGVATYLWTLGIFGILPVMAVMLVMWEKHHKGIKSSESSQQD